MSQHQEMVRALMNGLGQAIPTKPTLEGYPFALRIKLMVEELFEFIKASGAVVYISTPLGPVTLDQFEEQLANSIVQFVGDKPPNMVEMIDALCDLLYVTYGAGLALGANIDPFFAEVHRANMTKIGGPKRSDGKGLKPDGWTPPDIAGVLKRQMEGSSTRLDALERAETEFLLSMRWAPKVHGEVMGAWISPPPMGYESNRQTALRCAREEALDSEHKS